MTSVHDRLQLKRIALDKWTVREQLCLASAVSCSGDQNWMSVSRSLKMLCGSNRPADWFSQKSCAVQYGELLENVETPKRKKRTANERDNQTAETPTESILRKLTQERVAELKGHIQAEQEEYAKLREDILAVQNASTDEKQLRELWSQIEQEMEQERTEKQRHEQWLKDREERKSELHKVSRVGLFQTTPGLQQKPTQLNLTLKSEDVETDDGSSKQGASPLLTSLLKSPASTPTTSNSPTGVRAAAPTITNLLTGSTNSVLAMGTIAPGSSFQLIQNQPLTGPVPIETTPQVTQSPSQAAPTLSMLLENKNANKPYSSNEQLVEDIKTEENVDDSEPMETEDGSCSPNKDEELMEVFNGLIPDNLNDEDIEEILTNNNGIILNSELLEEEESILENVDSLIGDQEGDDKSKAADERTKVVLQESKNMLDSSSIDSVKESIKVETEPADANIQRKIEDSSGGGFHPKPQEAEIKNETEIPPVDVKKEDESPAIGYNSDKSSFQILDSKDANKIPESIKEAAEVEAKSTEPLLIAEPLPKRSESTFYQDNSMETGVKEDRDRSTPLSTDSQSRKQHNSPEKKQNPQEEADRHIMEHDPVEIAENTNEATSDTATDITTTITIIDTDEDTTMEVIKEDKIGKAKRDYSRKKPEHIERRLEDIDENRLSISIRKLKERDGSESPLIDDETSDSIPRTRRRYSSTPNIDSIPNSPASSDDREYRAWKKSVLAVHSRICSHKYAAAFLKAASEDSPATYKQIILRPVDLQAIKNNIESGVIRTTAEFQRDVMLMCQNAIMFYSRDSNMAAMAKEVMSDIAMAIENLVENARKDIDQRSGGNSAKNRGRKSNRLP